MGRKDGRQEERGVSDYFSFFVVLGSISGSSCIFSLTLAPGNNFLFSGPSSHKQLLLWFLPPLHIPGFGASVNSVLLSLTLWDDTGFPAIANCGLFHDLLLRFSAVPTHAQTFACIKFYLFEIVKLIYIPS